MTDDVPLQCQATSRHKGPLRVKQRPSNCAFEQAAWSVSWWLVDPSGPVDWLRPELLRCDEIGKKGAHILAVGAQLISRWIYF